MEQADVVVVGGGQSGLAAAHVARRCGLAPVVLEAGDEPVGSWPRYYDSLTLFSPARYSALPGMPFPGDPERYPRRDEVVAYLRAYGTQLDADVRCGQRAERVRVVDGAFEVVTATGMELRAERLIAASGGFGAPHRPRIPGLDGFGGTVLHAADYRSPEPFAGSRVIVVGAGNSAVQIAAELAAVATVTIASRAPLRFRPQRPLGRDIHWWLTATRLDTAPFARRLAGRTTPVLDDGRYRAAISAGRPEHRLLSGRLDADVVILATGYRPHLPYLAGTGALDAEERPLHRRGVSTVHPGLGYVGLEHQRSIASATIRGVGADAHHVLAGMGPVRWRGGDPWRRRPSTGTMRAARR